MREGWDGAEQRRRRAGSADNEEKEREELTAELQARHEVGLWDLHLEPGLLDGPWRHQAANKSAGRL